MALTDLAPPSGPDMTDQSDDRPTLAAGTRVEVRSRFDQRWSQGFEVIEALDRGYRVRRLSDRTELPVVIDADDVRKERERKRNMWWY